MHCLERGHLMGKIWWSEMELFNRLLKMMRRKEAQLQAARAGRDEEKAMLEARVAELEAEVRALRGQG